jgi:hypothetical protein
MSPPISNGFPSRTATNPNPETIEHHPMQQWTTQFEWSFPLGIPGVALALLAAVALAAVSYRFTPRTLKKAPRAALAGLRFLFFATLIACLCRPTITRTQAVRESKKKTIAVLIDESSSMEQATLSGSTRFENARTFWERSLKPHSDQYAFQLYQFGQAVRPVDEFKPQTPAAFTPTQLYKNIGQWNEMFPAQGIDGVVCLTDGIDTSGSSADEAVNALMNTPLPHVFVPVTAAVAGPPFAAFRKLEVVPVAKLNTRTPVALVTSTSGKIPGERTMLTVCEGQTEIHRAELPASNGKIETRTHTFDLLIDQPGTHRYTAQIKAGNILLAQTQWSVEGTTKDYLKVLLYQGGLDWGTRYLRSVFDRDTRSELTVAFAPNAFPALMASERNETLFPSIDALSAYDVVIILKMRREQMSGGMEETLREFVSTGGSLLFVIANTLDAQSYIGSPLEQFLPVEFESIADASGHDDKTARFLQSMEAYRNASSAIRTRQSDGTVELRLKAPLLYPFQLTEEGRRSPAFAYLQNAGGLPGFQDFALVRKSKPGARVLAVHPELSAGDSQRILLAQQAFGEGQVAVLATDPLWRWKLTSQSSDASFDEFWKGCLAWLGAGRIHATYWNVPSKTLTPGTPVECTLNLSSRSETRMQNLRATLTDLETQETKVLTLAFTDRTTRCTATFTPSPGHAYQLSAFNGNELLTETFLSCPAATGHKELQELNPDVDALRRLAATSFRHGLVQTGEQYDWKTWLPDQPDETNAVKTETHLWHKPWVFLLMLALFLGELIIRRRHKLV